MTSDDDNAVVTVKPRRALFGSDALSRMAGAIAQQPGWRCELVLVPSDADLERRLPDSAGIDRVDGLLAQARDLRGSSIAIERAGLDLSSPYPSAAMKTLFAYGPLSREAYDRIDAAIQVRDDIAHGRRTHVDAEPWLAAIEPIVRELLTGAIS